MKKSLNVLQRTTDPFIKVSIMQRIYLFKEISLYYFLADFNDGKARTLVSLTGTIEVFYEGQSHHKDNWSLPLFQERDYYNMSKYTVRLFIVFLRLLTGSTVASKLL